MKRIIFVFLIVSMAVACKKDAAQIDQPGVAALVLDSLKVLSSDIPAGEYTDMAFIDEHTGFAVGAEGVIIKTTDGGLHWQGVYSSAGLFLRKVQFINNLAGYALGTKTSGSYLLKTLDGGITWQPISLTTPAPDAPSGFFFVNSNVGFLVGNKLFRKTVDGGQTWTEVLSSAPDNVVDIEFKTSSDGYAVSGEGKYYRTTNRGESWQVVQTKVTAQFQEIAIAYSKVYARSGNTLVDLSNGEVVGSTPAAASEFLFITDEKSIGIGQHYENGFWPYGDIYLSNNKWSSSVSKKFMPEQAINFRAIAKAGQHKTIILGNGHLQATVVQLSY